MAKRTNLSHKTHATDLAPTQPTTLLQPFVRRRPTADANMTADYIASMLTELAAMSGEARLDLLTYLLQLARVEAEGFASMV